VVEIIEARTEEEFAAARRLFVEYADWLGENLYFQGFEQELESLPGAYAPPTGCLLLAREGDTWAGCVAVRRLEGDVALCEMKRLWVRPAYRERGLGRRLGEEIMRRARVLGYGRMRLDTLADMTPARRLYESLGFYEIPAYYNNPLDDVVYYEARLGRTGTKGRRHEGTEGEKGGGLRD